MERSKDVIKFPRSQPEQHVHDVALQLHASLSRTLLLTDLTSRILCVGQLVLVFPAVFMFLATAGGSKELYDLSSFILGVHFLVFSLVVIVWSVSKTTYSHRLRHLFANILSQSDPASEPLTKALIKWNTENQLESEVFILIQRREPVLWLLVEIVAVSSGMYLV